MSQHVDHLRSFISRLSVSCVFKSCLSFISSNSLHGACIKFYPTWCGRQRCKSAIYTRISFDDTSSKATEKILLSSTCVYTKMRHASHSANLGIRRGRLGKQPRATNAAATHAEQPQGWSRAKPQILGESSSIRRALDPCTHLFVQVRLQAPSLRMQVLTNGANSHHAQGLKE